jgi:hypothetical protein
VIGLWFSPSIRLLKAPQRTLEDSQSRELMMGGSRQKEQHLQGPRSVKGLAMCSRHRKEGRETAQRFSAVSPEN